MRYTSSSNIPRDRQGLTLTETAIVMTVVGLTLSAIWAGMTAVNEYFRIQQSAEDVLEVVGNMRTAYAAQIGIGQLGFSSLTTQLIQTGGVPSNMMRDPTVACSMAKCVDSPWGYSFPPGTIAAYGTFGVCDWDLSVSQTACVIGKTSNNLIQTFAVLVEGMSNSSCSTFVNLATGSGGAPGLLEVNINGVNLGPTSPNPIGINPVSLPNALNACKAANGSNVVSLVYRISSSSS